MNFRKALNRPIDAFAVLTVVSLIFPVLHFPYVTYQILKIKNQIAKIQQERNPEMVAHRVLVPLKGGMASAASAGVFLEFEPSKKNIDLMYDRGGERGVSFDLRHAARVHFFWAFLCLALPSAGYLVYRVERLRPLAITLVTVSSIISSLGVFARYILP